MSRSHNNEHFVADRVGQKLHDPYISEKGLVEPAICTVCGAVYSKKRWSFDEKLKEQAKKNKDVRYTKCPADRKIEDKYAMGKIILSGSFINEHFNEIFSAIKSEERKAMENNPLDKFILIEKRDDGIYAETTSDALAERIGQHLKKAYKGGEEEMKFRSGDKFIEILWHRD